MGNGDGFNCICWIVGPFEWHCDSDKRREMFLDLHGNDSL